MSYLLVKAVSGQMVGNGSSGMRLTCALRFLPSLQPDYAEFATAQSW
jgi:hypothetical protein